jgi:hypothetical protein
MVFGTTEESALMNLHLKVISLMVRSNARLAYVRDENILFRWKMEKFADS